MVLISTLSSFCSGTYQEVQIEITEFLVHVTHHISSDVLIVRHTLSQVTLLVSFIYSTTRSTVSISRSLITVNTYTSSYIPPIGDFVASIDSTSETFCFIFHLILIQDPVWIFCIANQILQTFEHTVFSSVFIQVVSYIIRQRPAIKSCHGTVTSLTIQTT